MNRYFALAVLIALAAVAALAQVPAPAPAPVAAPVVAVSPVTTVVRVVTVAPTVDVEAVEPEDAEDYAEAVDVEEAVEVVDADEPEDAEQPVEPMMAQAAPPAPPEPPAPAARPAPPAPPAPPMDWRSGKGSYLGIGVQEVDPDRAKELKLGEVRGVEITMVGEDTPAAKAGLKEDDVVLEFNGQRVEGVEQFVRLVRETPPGRQIKLLISRNGATQTLTATVGERKAFVFHMDDKFAKEMEKMGEEMGRRFGDQKKFQKDMEKLQNEMKDFHFEFHMPDMPEGPMGWKSPVLGVEVETINAQLAEFFGVKQGALVRSVAKDSAAEKAGIKAGDVIVKVGTTEIAQAGQISKTIREAPAGKPVPLTVVRSKREVTLNVTPEPRPTGSAHPAPHPMHRVPRSNFAPPARMVSLHDTSL